ncbi:MAG: aminotransferase class I/II-fold pyridoxal phosphate-dependent enzyme [Candidatus Eremiobacteraeota bacterium]|nr:aminotransferase class I/II-fold pyridoxal phosphate-dependent enzyme [Candidatus Eremiobacteraeota bacterium]
MKAVILAAGAGRRMYPLTQETHKCLLPVGDSTLVDRMLEGLLQVGVSEVMLLTGYMHDQLQAHLGSAYKGMRLEYVFNERFEDTNNVVSLLRALQGYDLRDEFLLLEADLIFDFSVLRRAVDSPASEVAILAPFKSGMDGTVAELREGWVHDIIPPERQQRDGVTRYKTVNIYKFSHAFAYGPLLQMLAYYTERFEENCYYEKILGMLIYAGQLRLKGEVLGDEAWAELDDPHDVVRAQAIFDGQRLLNQLEYNFGGLWNFPVIDFNFIRNIYFPTDAMVEEMRQKLPDLMHNYGSRQAVMDGKMATFLRCQEEPLILLNGASQAYPILAEFYAGKKVLIPSPTFGEYSRVFSDADTFRDHPDESQDLSARLGSYGLVVLVNPNNPTGTLWSTATLWKWISEHPQVDFLVDESFIDFSDQPSLTTLEALPNLIVLKSLGKSLGVPGLRMGYLYTHKRELHDFFQVRLPIWNNNSLAEFFLETGLKHRDALQRSFVATRLERERMKGLLAGCPGVGRIWPSAANFFLVEITAEVDLEAILRQMLRLSGIYVKDISSKVDCRALRIAVRTAEDNDLFVECWKKCYPLAARPATSAGRA